MASDKEYIGIDLGTSNSVACVYINGEPTLIPSTDGINMYGPSFPSYVAFDDNKVLVGEAAKRRYTTHPDDVVRAVKKDMDKNIKREYHGKMYSPQEISAHILKKIKDDAEVFLDRDVNDAIITVPAYFDDNQRTATKDAARIAGLNAEIINEPTAASLAYGIKRSKEGLQRILVFDLGGGTFDVTIMEFGAGIFEVKSTSGDTQLGGTDMDNILAEFLVKEFEKQHGVKLNLDMNRQLKNVLIDAAERAKIDLSTAYETEVNLPNMALDSNGNPLNLVTTISRYQLEELVKPIIKRCEKPLERALDDANLFKKDIHKLILVGGPTRMPIVRKFVQNFMGRSAEKGIDPMACVAQGAAINGGIKTGEITDVEEIIDVIPLSLGIISEGRLTKVLVERNTSVPIKRSKKFKTVEDNQEFIKVEIVQGEFKMADKNAYLGSFVLDIDPAPRGKVIVEITFDIDKSGILNVTAVDQSNGNKKSMRLDSPNKMSEAEVRRIRKIFIDESEKDEGEATLQGLINNAKEYIRDAKNVVKTGNLNYAEKEKIEGLIDSLQNAIDTRNKIKIPLGTRQLQKALWDLIE